MFQATNSEKNILDAILRHSNKHTLLPILITNFPDIIRNQWGDLGVDGWIILGRVSRRWDVGMWTGLGWPRIETDGERL